MLFKLKALLFLVSTISCASSKESDDVRLVTNSGQFNSPNYPDKYDHKANCSWTIVTSEENKIHLKFETFEVKSPFRKCGKDYVRVVYYEGHEVDVFCTESSKAHLPPELIKSTTNTLTVNLITDPFYFNGKGFLATYFVVDKFGNKVEPDEGDEDEFDPGWDDTTGLADKKSGTDVEKDTKDAKSVTHDENVTKPSKGKGKKGKGKKGRGKKNKKDREERRRLRKLQRQKEKAQKKAERALKRKERRARGKKKSAEIKN